MATEVTRRDEAAAPRDDRPDAVVDTRSRQRAEFGGINWGAGFFGWLVAVGLAVILTAILSAAGAAIGLSSKEATKHAGTVTVVGGALLLLAFVIAYFAGGYVAGRMSRFDGGRQGLASWLWGIIVTLLVAGLTAIAGSEYNIFQGLHLPRVPIKGEDLTTGGAIGLAAVVVGTLLAAILGGKAGQRYHRKVDRLDPAY
jgi:hypothetical protein